MKSSDRAILFGVLIVGSLAAFWFTVLSPKRAEVAKLDTEISELEATVAEQQQLVTAGEAAKDSYARNYHRLVVLGKAVPAGDDAPSLFFEIEQIAGDAGVEFDAITLASDKAEAPAPPPPAAEEAPAEEGDAADAPAVEVPPTEAASADLPIGATVGPAGLPTLPYDLELRGDFFELAAFFKGLDELVGADQTVPSVGGRLITINGFNLVVDEEGETADLAATVSVTTFVAPPDQGVVGGATAAAPIGATAVPTEVPAS